MLVRASTACVMASIAVVAVRPFGKAHGEARVENRHVRNNMRIHDIDFPAGRFAFNHGCSGDFAPRPGGGRDHDVRRLRSRNLVYAI